MRYRNKLTGGSKTTLFGRVTWFGPRLSSPRGTRFVNCLRFNCNLDPICSKSRSERGPVKGTKEPQSRHYTCLRARFSKICCGEAPQTSLCSISHPELDQQSGRRKENNLNAIYFWQCP